jgi:hypothetical protein
LPPDEQLKWEELDYSIDDESEQVRLGAEKVQQIRQQMQQIWQTDATKVEWAGSIPYETVEAWDWTACEYGPAADPCGVDHVKVGTRDVQVGTKKNGDPIYRKEDVYEDRVRSCWHDVDQTERRECSVEEMKFNAHFRRPSPSEWGPHLKGSKKGEGYYDIIPNKYDLLPGEVEDVQIFNTKGSVFSSASEVLQPAVEIGDAWNNYDTSRITSRDGTLYCKYNKTYTIDVEIETIKRRTDKKTPNAFRSPVDEYGKTLEPIRWLEVQSRSGKYINRGEPVRILLSDASASVIASMAKQSRKFSEDIEKAQAEVDREQREAKAEAGKKNLRVEPVKKMSKKDQKNQKAKFHRNTLVRVRLFEDVWLGRPIFRTQEVIWSSGEMQVPGRIGQYEIRFDTQDPEKYPYRSKAPYGLDPLLGQLHFAFRPKKNYYYEISMFQEGVDFYRQEDGVFTDKFSKPLKLNFKIQDIVDQRSFVQKFLDFQGQRKGIFFWK